MHKGYRLTQIILRPLQRIFFRVKVVGRENIPEEGGFVVCSNHMAATDVLKLGANCKRQLKFVAKKELFSIPILRGIMKAFGAVKIDRGGNDVGAIRAAIELAKNGDLVAIFPQGHRYPKVDPSTTPIKNGVALIAYRAGCPIIPACIKTKKNKYLLFRQITVYFGKPLSHEELGLKDGTNEEFKRASEIAFSRAIQLGGFPALPAHNNSEEDKGQ